MIVGQKIIIYKDKYDVAKGIKHHATIKEVKCENDFLSIVVYEYEGKDVITTLLKRNQ